MFSQRFVINHYELDHRGRLSVPYLCRMLQEGAGNDATRLGIATHQMVGPHGIAWVLARFHLKIVDAGCWPKWRDEVDVATWRVSHDRFLAVRDYRVTTATGRTFAVGTSWWAIFDIAKRRMAPIPAFVADNHPKVAERAFTSSFDRLPAIERVDFQGRVAAGLRDIDQNDHVNNVSYVNWAIEGTPRELSLKGDLVEVEVVFRAETRLDEELVVQGQLENIAGRTEALYELKRAADNRVNTQLKLSWQL